MPLEAKEHDRPRVDLGEPVHPNRIVASVWSPRMHTHLAAVLKTLPAEVRSTIDEHLNFERHARVRCHKCRHESQLTGLIDEIYNLHVRSHTLLQIAVIAPLSLKEVSDAIEKAQVRRDMTGSVNQK